MAFSLIGMFMGLTVRTRIVVLAAIPVVGFLANGTAFTLGQADVEEAFGSVRRATALAEASQDLKNALGSMRILVRDFAMQPGADLIQAFDDTHKASLNSLARVEAEAHAAARQEIAGLRQSLAVVKKRYDHLVAEQKSLGFSDSEGIRHRMRQSATAVERIINDEMGWLTKLDSQKLLVSLLGMRRSESDYRLNHTSLAQTEFLGEVRAFNQTLSAIIAAEIMKEGLGQQVKTYADTFSDWISSTNTVRADVASLDLDLRQVMPITDDIIAAARFNAMAASAALTDSQSRTRNIIVLVGCAAVLIGLGFQLADRTQHHAAAQRPRHSDEAARRRRYFGRNSRHPFVG